MPVPLHLELVGVGASPPCLPTGTPTHLSGALPARMGAFRDEEEIKMTMKCTVVGAGEQHDRQERGVVLPASKHQAPAGRPKLAASRKRTYTHNLTASVAVLEQPTECQPSRSAGSHCRSPLHLQAIQRTVAEIQKWST